MLPGIAPVIVGGARPIEVVAATTSTTTSSSPDVVTLPSGITAGEMLIVIQTMSFDGITFGNPSGWTRFLTAGGAAAIHAWYRVADGSEGSTLSLSRNGGSALTRALCFRIRNFTGTPEATATASATTSTTPDPPSLSPSWGSAKTLWIAMAYANNASSLSNYPTNYGSPDVVNNGNQVAAAWRTTTASSENPGVFTFNATNGSRAATFGLRSS